MLFLYFLAYIYCYMMKLKTFVNMQVIPVSENSKCSVLESFFCFLLRFSLYDVSGNLTYSSFYFDFLLNSV